VNHNRTIFLLFGINITRAEPPVNIFLPVFLLKLYGQHSFVTEYDAFN